MSIARPTDFVFLDSDTDDPNLHGIRRLFDLIEASPRVEASALLTLGSNGYDDFAIAVVIAWSLRSPPRQSDRWSKPIEN